MDRREELKRWVLAVIELKEKLPECEGVQLVSTCDLQTFSLLREVTQEVYANFQEFYPPGVLTGTEEGMSWLQRILTIMHLTQRVERVQNNLAVTGRG